MFNYIAASVFSLRYMEYVTRLDMKDLMFRSLRGGGDYGFYVIDQNPHSSMYGTSKAEVVNRGGRLYLKCPPKPEYDSTNDREFCCWMLLNSQTTDNNFPSKDWSNIAIARTELYNSSYPDNPVTVQTFGSTEYPIYGYIESFNRFSFLTGFVACYYQDYYPKWTFAIPEEVRTKLSNQETFGPTTYTMPLVEQRTNKGGLYYIDVSVVSGSIPSIGFDFYLPNNNNGYDVAPNSVVDRSKVINTESSIDFTEAINGGRGWTNWNSSVPIDYLPSMFRNTVTIENLEFSVYSSTSLMYNSAGYLENPISFPLDKLENVSISASIGASFHESGGGAVIGSGHFEDMMLSINGVNYPFSGGFTFRPSTFTDPYYLIIPSVFGELIEFSYINDDISQPNFGLPIE